MLGTLLPGGLAVASAVVMTMASASPAGSSRAQRATPRLSPCGSALCRPDGSRFHWRGVTAFALADLLADGKDEEARAFVRWAADGGFTVLRVLAMNHGWMDLPPLDGRRALPRLFALASEHGLYVQVVALAGTAEPRFRDDAFLREQVRQVGMLCAATDNCVMELANEPYHGSQADLDDPARLKRLQQEVPDTVPVAWGAARRHTADRLSGGDFVVAHVDRGGDRWSRVARVTELAELSRRTGKFVVDNEPIGAAEQAARRRRDDMPAAFYAQAALAGLLGVGATFHCEDCLLAQVPGPVQRRSAAAFAEGAAFAAAAGPLDPVGPDAASSPVARMPAAPPGPTVLAFARGSTAAVVALGAHEQAGLAWRPGWRVVDHVSPAAAVHVWRLRHEP